MRTGILGLPGCGKSTLFDLLAEEEGAEATAAHKVHAPNKPRVRTVKVHDPRLAKLRDDYSPKKYTPAAIELLDFPAVTVEVEDRSGLADLLAPAREVDALILVIRDFINPSVPGGDAVDPAADFGEVLGELILADLVVIERRLEKLADKSRKPIFTDEDRKEQALLEGIKGRLEKEDRSVFQEMAPEDRKRFLSFGFLSAKPWVTVLNAETGNIAADRVAALQKVAGGEVLPIAARSELEILALPESERPEFLKEYGIQEFMRDPLLRAVYRAAGRISFFTAGDKEVRAWTIRAGDTAPQAAGAIHTDFERGFIRAEVLAYEDYIKYGGVKGAKEKGHYRLEGREYVVKEGDIVVFRFST